MKISNSRQENPVLLTGLMQLLQHHRPAFGQERVFNRAVALVLAELFAFARHTMTQLLLTLGIVDDDWSAWYRLLSQRRFQEEKSAQVLLEQVVANLPESEMFVTGIDGFQVPRNSHTMPGTCWQLALNTAPFLPGIRRAQCFLDGAWLTPLVNGFSRAIPLRCLPAFPGSAVPSPAPARSEWEAGWRYLKWLRQSLDRLGRTKQRVLALADGNFDTVGLWAELPERVSLLVRTSRNRALYQLPQPATGRGRPARYGQKAPAPAAWLQRRKGFQRTTVVVRGKRRPMRYRLEGPFLRDNLPHIPLFLLVIGGGRRPPGSRRKNYQPCFYLVSALPSAQGWQLPLPLTELLAWLWQRWELEVAHRNMKSGLGLGEKQCWNPYATISSVQWSAWVYGLLLLVGHLAWGLNGGPAPPGRWRQAPQRWSFNTLWRSFRAELWQRREFQASWTPTRDNWLKKEPFFAALSNAILASTRT